MYDVNVGVGEREYISVMVYGPSRTGKTRFAAQFPRPVFFSDARERGWETIRTMPRELFFEPDRLPIVWAIESGKDIFDAVDRLRQMLAKDPQSVKTVVIDSLTHYLDTYFAFLESRSTQAGKRADMRMLYGDLAAHLRALSTELHKFKINLVYLALAKQPSEENTNGGPLLPGQNAEKLPAVCNSLLYSRVTPAGIYELRTRQFGAFPAGCRDENVQDPIEPTFAAFASISNLVVNFTATKPAATPPAQQPKATPAAPVRRIMTPNTPSRA